MRGRLSSVLFVIVFSGPTYLACQLVDPPSDLDGQGDGNGDSGSPLVDSAAVDGAHPVDATSDVTVADASGDAAAGDGSPGSGDAGAVDAASFCDGVDAWVCDGFDVNGALDLVTVPNVSGASCDGIGTIDVAGGRLTVDHQTNNGTGYSNCALVTVASANVTGFALDFDYAYQLKGDYTDTQANQYAIVSTVIVQYDPDDANDAGIDNISFQVLMNGEGSAQFIAVAHYPRTNDFPTYQLCNLYDKPWMAQGTSCHIALTANTFKLTGTATATCGTTVTALTAENDDPPPGISAPAMVNLGYTQNAGSSEWAEWQLTYDNLLFRTVP